MNRFFFLILLVSSSVLCIAQNELKTKNDSIEYFEEQITDLKNKLEYGEDKSVAYDGGGVTCKVIKAFYDSNLYLCVIIEFLCENDSPILKFNNESYCLLAEKRLKISRYNGFLNSENVKLEEGVKKNLILDFTIYKEFKGPKPRLIEYLKLKEKQTDHEFVFRNIPIDYDEDR